MEYAPLTWMSSARCHLKLLDKVQQRAERLIAGAQQPAQQQQRHPQQQQQQLVQPSQQSRQQQHEALGDPVLRDSLEHRRKVAALTVLYKAQVAHVPHLMDLRATWRRSERSTRTVLSGNDFLLEVPRSHSNTHQRALSSATVKWWNDFTSAVNIEGLSTQQVKVAAHRWLRLTSDSDSEYIIQ